MPAGAAVSREQFDLALAQAAVDAGADALFDTSGRLLAVEPACRRVELTGSEGRIELPAKVILVNRSNEKVPPLSSFRLTLGKITLRPAADTEWVCIASWEAIE